VPGFRTGTVTALRSERKGLQRVEVDGEAAFVLTELLGPVALGDRVVVNTTAVDLGLGSGGAHVVHWNLAREMWHQRGPGHVLKLRYTSLQADTGVAEEAMGPAPATDLGGLPVVACDLHSQVACVALAFAAAAPGRRLVYVMTDAAALPLALSDVVAELRGRGVLAATVSAGQAFGGDLEAVNVASGIDVASRVAGAETVVVGPGPGVVGTRTRLGFGGLEVAGIVDVAARLGAQPIVVVRWSDADPRAEHRGVSHHTRTCLELAAARSLVAVPAGRAWPGEPPPGAELREVEVDAVDLGGVTTMGRGPEKDPGFFAWAAAAGTLAARLAAAPDAGH